MRDAVAVGDDDIILVPVIEEARDSLERFETVAVRCIRFIGIGRQQDDTAVFARKIPVFAAA